MTSFTKDQPLTKEEQEEEEMRNELSNAGMYEDNMSVDEMRQLMKAVNESKKDLDESLNNLDSEPPEASSFTEQKHQSPPEDARTILQKPLPSFSYRNAVVTNNATVAGPAYDILKKGSNPESVYDASFETTTNQTDDLSHESTSKKNSSLSEDYPALNSGKSGANGPRLRSHGRKPTAAMLKKYNLDKVQMSQFDFVFDENFTIPKELENKNLEINPELLNDESLETEKFDEMVDVLSKELDTLHEQMMEAELSKLENDMSQWGSPIKAATKTSWNGSLDKNTPLEEPEESTSRSNTNFRGTHDRATKRKALNTISTVTRDDSSQNIIDDESDDELFDMKKRKCQQVKKAEEAKKVKEVPKSKAVGNNLEMIEVENNGLKNSQPTDFEFDNSDLHSLRKSTNNDSLQNSKVIDDRPQYPIRVSPPILIKKSNKGPRAKNKKTSQSESNNDKIKKKMGISDEEITKVLHTLDEHIDEKDNDCIEITNEAKEPSTSKKIQNRLQLAQESLFKVHEEEEMQKLKIEESQKRKEKEEAQKKNELVKKRLSEMEEEKKLKEEKEKKDQESEELHNAILNTRQKGRVTRANHKKVTRPNYEEIDENVLLGGDDDEPMITNIVTKNQCPICLKSFPTNQIEEHASECNAFDDKISFNQPSASYSCNICKKFYTHDGISFEEHVVRCKEEANDKRTGIYA